MNAGIRATAVDKHAMLVGDLMLETLPVKTLRVVSSKLQKGSAALTQRRMTEDPMQC